MDPLAQRLMLRYEFMAKDRGTWENHWDECARYVLPRKDNQYGSQLTRGSERAIYSYDGTPIQANETLASSLNGMVVSASDKWLEWATGIPELDHQHEVIAWLQHVADRMLAVYKDSNFYTEAHEVFLDLGALGTSTLYQEEDDKHVVKFMCRPIYDFYIDCDRFKKLTTVCEKCRYYFYQLIDEFGIDAIPQRLKEQYQSANDNARESIRMTPYTVLHFVFRNKEYDMEDITSRRFSSIWLLKDTGDILKKSGYHEMPYAIPRWTISQDEIYGRSPAMKALPDIRMLNSITRYYLRSVQKVSDPPLQAPSDGFLKPYRTGPGAMNYYDPTTQNRIEPINTGARPDISNDLLRDVRLRIQQAFFTDKLQLRDGPQMTATETLQRTEEQMRVMGPQISRLRPDFIVPTVERTFGIMLRKKMFDPAPQILKDREIKIKLVSKIEKAQKMGQADSLLRTVNAVQPLVEGDPVNTLKVFKPDEAIRIFGALFGLPFEVLKTPAQMQAENQKQMMQNDALMESEIEKNEAKGAVDTAKADALEQGAVKPGAK